MKYKIKSPLVFIQKKDLVEFEINIVNGATFLASGKFKQLIKASEMKQIEANRVQDEPIVRKAVETPVAVPDDDEVESVVVKSKRGRKNGR